MIFRKVLIANRGAVAARVLRTLRKLGIPSIAVYSEADAGAPYLEEADEAYCIGPPPARASYLNQDALLEAAERGGADALHPGYGFLSENAAFASRVESRGICFIGPSARWIADMGEKTRARELAAGGGLPVTEASGLLPPGLDVRSIADRIGYPLLIKPACGGGGIGMMPAWNGDEVVSGVDRSRSLAERAFGNGDVYLERLLIRPRHIEFQILGDRHGALRHLFERDCSVQRRHQKLIEEAPAPMVDRARIDAMANQIAKTLGGWGYDNIGTVEMLMERDGSLRFLEMNTRLQVEHGVTEAITGIDLVEAQIRSAAGEHLDAILPVALSAAGHSIETRVYAEDPTRFLPSPGRLEVFRPPLGAGVRIETGYREGRDVTPYYDALLAKVIVHAPDRPSAIRRIRQALAEFEIQGVKTNLQALLAVLQSEEFQAGDLHTGLLSLMPAERRQP